MQENQVFHFSLEGVYNYKWKLKKLEAILKFCPECFEESVDFDPRPESCSAVNVI